MKHIVIFFLLIYKKTFSPSTGIFRFLPGYPKNTCVFYPTCSTYTIECFQKYSFKEAVKKSARRICRCHPATPPQVDLP